MHQRRNKNSSREFTDGFEEERIVVKVILDEHHVSLTLFSSALDQDVQSTLRKGAQILMPGNWERELTSSSMSTNTTPLASRNSSKMLLSRPSTDHPRRPLPSGPQPATPLRQATLPRIFGVFASLDRPPGGCVAMIGTISTNPSKLRSPILRGTGRGGSYVVSKTRSWGVLPPGVGTSSSMETRTKACECVRDWEHHGCGSYRARCFLVLHSGRK
jgi:hypothetical protein